ncbi:hypothetical protein SANA_14210 [Gottschalkiaceae bacterium SANA]|nr:hypothetical protein SANA_14210 [Gottschalkiaceae bacterium SANA]
MKSKKIETCFCISLLVILAQFVVLVYSLIIYTSLYKWLPWYEGAGIQFLIIPFVFLPILLALGVLMKLLSRKYEITKFSTLLPFVSGGLIVLPILADGGLGTLCISFGIVFSLVLIGFTIYSLVSSLRIRFY